MNNIKIKVIAVVSLACLVLFAAESESKPEQTAVTQKTCPVMGGAIDKKQYADVKGKRIYVCCAGCIAKIKADPDTYIKKLESSGIALDKAEEKKD
ncbi:MAG: hypothetical protein WC340_08650 [Kiritimatiellia bacterium]|jgi:hypothetical protein